MVKLSYEDLDNISYPLVVITEIVNTENSKYSTDKGEQVTNLTYQVESICDTTELSDKIILDASRSAKLLGTKISKLLGGENYKLERKGDDPLKAISSDRTIMRYINRYEGCLYLKQNIIYRR